MSKSNDTDDNDVPPLEDMSELLHLEQQLQQKEKQKTNSKRSGDNTSSDQGPKPETVAKTEDKKNPQNGTKVTTAPTAPKPSPKPASFGGMKKGFLFGPPTKSSKSKVQKQTKSSNATKQNKGAESPKSSSDIPLIKPHGDGAHNGAHRISDVQDALKATAPFLQNRNWITEDLLTKIDKHPRLASQITDPRFSQAMKMFQSSPHGAMQHFQDNPEMQRFLQDFCEILGEHFTKLGIVPGSSPSAATPSEVKVHDQSGADMKVASSTNPNQPTAVDEAKLRKIMADPDVVKAFGDSRTAPLFEALKTDPEKAHRIILTADAEFRRHIKTLIDNGLLGVAQQ